MGIRISMYAVELTRLEAIARMSLRELMQSYSEYPDAQANAPYMYFNADMVRYHARPGQGSYRQNQRLTPDAIIQDDFLSTLLKDYIAQGSSLSLSLLFNCLSCYADRTGIYQISRGHRRWWMGSFLEYAEQFYGPSTETFTRLVALFQKILCGYDCGKILKKDEVIQHFEPDFPLIPGEEVDMHLAVLNRAELNLLMQAMNDVPESTRFHAPSGKVGIAPDDDADWNEWVWKMIMDLRVLNTLKNEVNCLVTLIG